MSDDFNAALVKTIQAHMPSNSNPSYLLAERLHVGRDAAYRRLRGEVMFSFPEAAVLSTLFDFSLDAVAGAADRGRVQFHWKFRDFDSSLEVYNRLFERDIRFFREAACDPSAEIASATNSIPAEFYLRYEHLARFKLFKWLYQHDLTEPSVRAFEDFSVPAHLSANFRKFITGSRQMARARYVLDESCFKHWINAILAFRDMHLISRQSIRLLREELLLLIAEMEHIAASGENENGNEVSLYLSGLDIESTYFYITTERRKIAGIGLFSLNSLHTADETMYEYVRQWVRTLSRFSMLISRSGELQRIHYFRRQRKLLAELE